MNCMLFEFSDYHLSRTRVADAQQANGFPDFIISSNTTSRQVTHPISMITEIFHAIFTSYFEANRARYLDISALLQSEREQFVWSL
jgi:hypothetical protein